VCVSISLSLDRGMRGERYEGQGLARFCLPKKKGNVVASLVVRHALLL
jgi:hypothetical protein